MLAAWLLGQRRQRAAATHVLALAGAFVLANLPFLVRWPHQVLYAYRQQGTRGITAESLYYLPLRFLHVVESQPKISHGVGAPMWATTAAIGIQALVLLAILVAAASIARDILAGVSLAAIAPTAFLLTNRVFSPQFFVTFVAGWAVAGALLARNARDLLAFGLVVFSATLANVLVYPTYVAYWPVFSALMFLLAFAATGWVLARVIKLGRESPPAARASVTRPRVSSSAS